MKEPLLEVKGLCKRYKRFALEDISFVLPPGYIMGYVGPNGAGKTTTIDLITSLRRPTEGQVLLDGLEYDREPVAYVERIGFVGDTSFFPEYFRTGDVRRVLKLFYGTFDPARFDGLLEEWQLPKDRKLADFSRGMKVKLMFAAALARDTRLLILDEATNGLDPVMRAQIIGLLQAYVEDGKHSIFFSTHILSDLEQIADFILLIDRGRLFFNGTKDDLLESYLLVRGDAGGLSDAQRACLIGPDFGSYGFEGLIKADDAVSFGKEYVLEKPDIDRILLHSVKQRDVQDKRREGAV